MKIRIKYFEGATKLQKISKGNWIDVYSNKDVFVAEGERTMIPLGFALELPKGWEGHLAPRSSTFKTWGVIQTNHVGVVDDSFVGDNDQWHLPVYCLQGKGYEFTEEEIEEKFKEFKNVTCSTSNTKCLIYEGESKEELKDNYSTYLHIDNRLGTWIKKGDKIGQFRIMEVMPELEFEEVESFGNADRGGFGTTSSR